MNEYAERRKARCPQVASGSEYRSRSFPPLDR